MSEVVAFSHQVGISFTIHWIIMDEKACNLCKELGATTFTQNDLEESWLMYRGSPVWDLAVEQSMVHPNCRCILDIDVDIDMNQFMVKEEEKMVFISELKEQIANLKEEMNNLTMSYHELREMETLLMRTLILLERSTGSKEVAQAINIIQRLITVIRMAQFAIHALEAASGPLGWAFALSSVVMTGWYAGATIEEMTSR